MKMYLFEGTPDEISQVMSRVGSDSEIVKLSPEVSDSGKSGKPPLPLGNVKPSANYDDEREFVTTKFARTVMTRIELSDPLRAVLVALYQANPAWVSAADLYKASGYEGQRFAGLMGAFGRRMKYTNGYDDEACFFDYDWDDAVGAWCYRLPPTVIEAIRLEGIA